MFHNILYCALINMVQGLILLGSFYVAYYLVFVRQKLKLISRKGKFYDFLESHISVINQTYWPLFWAYGARRQMAVFLRLKPYQSFNYRREILDFKDGGQVALDWVDNDNEKFPDGDTRPICLILPGLTGSSEANYVFIYGRQILNLGLRLVVFNYRGKGGLKLKTPRTYSASDFEDLTSVIDHIQATYPKAPIFSVGISFGGTILLHYLAHCGRQTPLKSVLLLSCVWDIIKSSHKIGRWINKMFNDFLTVKLLQIVKDNRQVLSQRFDVERILQVKSLREYDTELTCPMFGYSNADSYYQDCLTEKIIERVKVPVLCLSSTDDTFAPKNSIPMKAIVRSPNVALILTTYGAHNVFMKGLFPSETSISEKTLHGYLNACVSNQEQLNTFCE